MKRTPTEKLFFALITLMERGYQSRELLKMTPSDLLRNAERENEGSK